ncbi:hypothetical protein LNI88_04940 [Tenacibaculum dicentrarchi]|nr:hypothetical protein [Tenacibaculum dicentrarchi]
MRKLISVFIPIVLGLGMLGVSIWLFFLAKDDNTYLLLFGLGTAILVPISLSLISYGINFSKRKTDKKLSELSKISDIKSLLDETKTTEEQLEILKIEYQNLEKNLRYNSEKISLELRRNDLEQKAREILTELNILNEELEIVENNLVDYKMPIEIQLLRERVFEKEIAIVRFKDKTYTYEKNSLPDIGIIPTDGLVFEIYKGIERYQKRKLKIEVDKINSEK